MSDSSSRGFRQAGHDAVSAVKMSRRLTAEVDAWAEAHGMVRSEAICRLVELGLGHGGGAAQDLPPHDPLAIEAAAVMQICEMLDPALPIDERERRIRRLTEGPPEFSGQRIDLPKHRE
jgi:hypothetical protein